MLQKNKGIVQKQTLNGQTNFTFNSQHSKYERVTNNSKPIQKENKTQKKNNLQKKKANKSRNIHYVVYIISRTLFNDLFVFLDSYFLLKMVNWAVLKLEVSKLLVIYE